MEIHSLDYVGLPDGWNEGNNVNNYRPMVKAVNGGRD